LLIEEGIAAWQSTGAEMGLPHFYSLLAQAHLLQEDTKRGLQAITQGQYYVRKNGEESFASELIRLKGELLIMKANAAAGDERHRLVEQAETCFMEALKIAKSQGAKSLELRAAMSWYQHFPTNKTAQVTLRTIYDSFTEGWDTHDLKEARRLLL
jgi:predicted ATPase